MTRPGILLLFLFLTSLLRLVAQESRGTKALASNEDFGGDNYALILGVSEYKNLEDLQYADADALALRDFLYLHPDFEKENIICLVNEKVDKFSIDAAFGQIYQQMKTGDRLYLYFAGHGDVPTQSQKHGYLLFHNAPADGSYTFGDAISTSTLNERLNYFIDSKQTEMVLIVDACRKAKFDAVGASATLNALSEPLTNTVKLLSCRSDQLSYEYPEIGHGVFTYYLIEALTGQAEDFSGDNCYDEEELIEEYVKTKVREKTDRQQTPEYVGAGKIMPAKAVAFSFQPAGSGGQLAKRGLSTEEVTHPKIDAMLKLAQEGRSLNPIYGVDRSGIFSDIQSVEYPVHTDLSYAVAYSPNNQKVYIGSGNDKNLAVFDTRRNTFEKIETNGGILSMAVSPDGRYLALGNWFDKVQILDIEATKVFSELTGNKGDVRSLRFSADGKYLIAGDNNGYISIWSATEGWNQLKVYRGHSDRITDIACLEDGLFVTSSLDGTVKKWGVDRKEAFKEISLGKNVLALESSSDGSRLIAANDKQRLFLLSGDNLEQLMTVGADNTGVNDLLYTPDGKYLFVLGRDYNFDIHDANSLRQIKEVQGSSRGITSGALSVSGSELYVSNVGGKLARFKMFEETQDALLYYFNEVEAADLPDNIKKSARKQLAQQLFLEADRVVASFINGGKSLPGSVEIREAVRKIDKADQLLGKPDKIVASNLEARRLSLKAFDILVNSQYDRYDDAIGMLEAVYEIDPTAVYVQNGISLLEKSRNELQKARESLKPAIENIPKWTEPKSNLGKTLLQSGDYAAAEAQFDKIIQLEPDRAKGYYLKGMLNRVTGIRSEARNYLQQALDRERDYIPAIAALAVLYLEDGDFPMVQSMVSELRKAGADFDADLLELEMRLDLYQNFYPSRSYRDELISFWKDIFLENKGAAGVVLAGLKLNRLSDDRPLDDWLVGIEKKFPFNPEIAAYAVDTKDSESWLNMVGDRLQNNSYFHTHEGEYYLLRKQYRQAISGLEVAIQQDARNYKAYNLLAQAYYMDRNIQGLLKLSEKMDGNFQEAVRPYYHLALLDKDNAQKYLKEAKGKARSNFYINSLLKTTRNPDIKRSDDDFSVNYINLTYEGRGIYTAQKDNARYLLGAGLTAIREYDDDTYLGSGLFMMQQDGKYGVEDLGQNIIVPPNYETIKVLNENFITVYNGEYFGLFNTNGKKLLPEKYSEIKLLARDFVEVDLFDKAGVYNKDGDQIVEPANQRIFLTTYKRKSVIATENQRRKYYYDEKGKCLNCKKRDRKR